MTNLYFTNIEVLFYTMSSILLQMKHNFLQIEIAVAICKNDIASVDKDSVIFIPVIDRQRKRISSKIFVKASLER